MQTILSWLRQPYPYVEGTAHMLRNAAVGGLFVTLFLFLFRPFGMTNLSTSEALIFRLCAEFGLVTVAVTFLWEGAKMAMPGVFREERWTVGREILSNLLFISLVGLGNMFYAAWRFRAPISLLAILEWQKYTFLIGIFPTAIGVFAKQMRLMRRYSGEASVLSAHLHPPAAMGESPSQTVTLEGENQNETITIGVPQLFYLSAADNYVQVFFEEQGQMKQRLLRSTLKKMEDALASHPQYFRCHRTFLVNLDHVEKLSGNAQGYRLHLNGVESPIPVSRALNAMIQAKFA